jgi:dTMP kinase
VAEEATGLTGRDGGAERGRFIVFEGPDGVGKSTHAARLARRMGALLTREPGGTELGRRVRELVLDRDTVGLDDRAEALLMAADRAQHVAEVVAPALAAGRHVVADRYLYSSVAYQGYGRNLGPVEVERLSTWATQGLLPDLVLLLDAPDDLLDDRRTVAPDRLEGLGGDFHGRVMAGYRAQAHADPERWVVIDAGGRHEDTALRVARAVESRLGLSLDAPAAGSPGGR